MRVEHLQTFLQSLQRQPQSDIMDQKKTITKFKEIWKETFGDSTRYIDLIYDNYYSPEFCRAIYREGNIASALTGIPYLFGTRDSGKNLKGLYLCGLATRPEFRRRGLMESLLEEVERQASLKGADFTFLIPADNHLREYYARLGYHSIMNRGGLKIDRGHEIYENRIFAYDKTDSRKFSILAKEGKIPSRLIDFIIEREKEFPGVSIRHTRKDVEVIIQESILSGGKIHLLPGKAVAIVENNTASLFMAINHDKATELLSHLIYIYEEITLLLPENSPTWRQLAATPRILEPYVMFKSINGNPLPPTITAYRLLD